MPHQTQPSGKKPAKSREDLRRARLAEALRANLRKRKTQARSRREGEADERPDGLAAAAHEGESGSVPD